MPSFGGLNIFGTALTMSTTVNPRAKQVNAYFGLDGLEVLDGGSRGRTTLAAGMLFGPTAPALAVAEATFHAMNDGVARMLVDTSGVIHPGVRLESFQPMGRIRRSPAGYFLRAYRARFLHQS